MITKDQAMKACFAVLCGMLAAKVVTQAFVEPISGRDLWRFAFGASLIEAAGFWIVYMLLNQRGRPEGRPKLDSAQKERHRVP